MKLEKVIAGELYATQKYKVVRCSRPERCRGSSSGFVVHMWDHYGTETCETRDHVLRKATMREQRDYWKFAYEVLCDEK